MLPHEIHKFLGRVTECPTIGADSLRDINIVKTEASPGLAIVILDVLVCGSLSAIALEDVLLAEIRLYTEQVSHIRNEIILIGRDYV